MTARTFSLDYEGLPDEDVFDSLYCAVVKVFEDHGLEVFGGLDGSWEDPDE